MWSFNRKRQMIKIEKEDFKEILALSDGKEKIFSIEEQIREVITRLTSTRIYAKDCTDVQELRRIIFYLRATRSELNAVIEKIISRNN